ncbi:MAG: thioredoxin domain-containing protein [Polyangiales bacterium]
MKTSYVADAVRIALLIAIGLSALLLAEYSSSSPRLCTDGGGCAEVAASDFSSVFGTPLPAIGVGALGTVFLLSLWPSTIAIATFIVALCAAAVVAALLLGVQAIVIERFCAYCVAIDLSVIGAASLAFFQRDKMRAPTLPRWFYAMALIAVVLLPTLRNSPDDIRQIPDSLANYQDDNAVDIIVLADLGCPHCREVHEKLVHVIEHNTEKPIHFVTVLHLRHEQDPTLLHAYACVEGTEVATTMTTILFQSQERQVDPLKEAATLGIDVDAFNACLSDPKTEKKVQSDQTRIHAAGVTGFPTVFVEGERIVGNVPQEDLAEAIARAPLKLTR